MKFYNPYARIFAALIIAGAGIAGLIDENTMIILTIVVICCMPTGRNACRAEGLTCR
jgi:hypothetical protein